jgi:hypothetical protein
MRRLLIPSLAAAAVLSVMVAAAAAADKPAEIALTLENQRFVPAEVKVKAGAPFVLVLTNRDAKPAEFESNDMRFEKVVAPGKTINVRVRALKPGTYVFFDHYNMAAQGKLTAE